MITTSTGSRAISVAPAAAAAARRIVKVLHPVVARSRRRGAEADQRPAGAVLVAAVRGISQRALHRQRQQQLVEVLLAAAGRAVLERRQQRVLLLHRELIERLLPGPLRPAHQRGEA